MDLIEQYVTTWKYKYAIFFGLLFLVSVYYSWQELVYLVRGRTAEATVTENYPMPSGRFGQNRSRVLDYHFRDTEGLPRKGADTIGMDEPIPGMVTVQYTPGEKGRSRIHGHVRWWALAIFGIAVAGLAFALYQLNRHMDEVMAPKSKKRK